MSVYVVSMETDSFTSNRPVAGSLRVLRRARHRKTRSEAG